MTNEEKMTPEEAHRILSNGLVNAPSEHEWCMAFEMAIKALEQKPCNAISREAVETLIDELARAISDERCCVSRGRSTATIMRDILHLPPVTPKSGKCKNCKYFEYNSVAKVDEYRL